VEVLVYYIQKGATSQTQIPVDSFKVDEFKIIAKRTQEMIDQREAQELLLEKQAFSDPITDLPNRNAFDAKITKLLREIRNGEPVNGAIVLMDIDHFKVTNDTFGHIFGNKVLSAIAARLVEDHAIFVARIGGDEFVAVIDHFESTEALDGYVNAIRTSFNRPMTVDERQLHFSTSIGVTIFPKDGDRLDDLIRKADLAMYRSKELGRNRYTYFDDSLLEGNYNFFLYDNKIKHALEADEFYLEYQPQYDSTTLEIIGLEGLVRWRTSDGMTIMPNTFIPIAEKTGTISSITQIVIKKACAFALKINATREKRIPVSINISTQDLTDPGLVEQLDHWTTACGIPTGDIMLEITETGLFENFESAMFQMERLKDKGYHFSLDDFGTGYSSLSYVMRLPIDVIKVDKSFVDSMVENEKSAKMIMVIEDIAKTLSLYTVAEGVETAAQAEMLARLGIQALQGYHFSRPLPENEIVMMLM
jgi:diguanylate cyclase (GGDEF)-like protein